MKTRLAGCSHMIRPPLLCRYYRCCLIPLKMRQHMIFGWLILVVAVIGRSVCDGIAITDADAQIYDQTDVDRPGKQNQKKNFKVLNSSISGHL